MLFVSDLLSSNDGGRELRQAPPELHEDPAETRRSIERLLGLDFDYPLPRHGEPIADDPKAAIRALLA